MTPMGPPQNRKLSSNVVLVVTLLVGGLCLLFCLATVVAIAVPSYMRFNVRAKQSEVKSNLKAAWVGQRAWFAEHDAYSESVDEVGFAPHRHNRYRYFFARGGPARAAGVAPGGTHTGVLADETLSPTPDNPLLEAGLPAEVAAELGVRGTCPGACRSVMAAVGNVDRDGTLDVWSISTEDRVLAGQKVPAGTPFCHVDDTRD